MEVDKLLEKQHVDIAHNKLINECTGSSEGIHEFFSLHSLGTSELLCPRWML